MRCKDSKFVTVNKDKEEVKGLLKMFGWLVMAGLALMFSLTIESNFGSLVVVILGASFWLMAWNQLFDM
jgi:hypothetical protein